MSDLISRSELFNKLATVQTLGEAYGIIQGMPIVDAVPVRHGRWKRKIVDCGFNADWVCSQCEQKYSDNPIMWEPKEGRRE